MGALADPVPVGHKIVAGRQFLDMTKRRERGRDIAQGEIEVDGLRIGLRRHQIGGKQGARF